MSLPANIAIIDDEEDFLTLFKILLSPKEQQMGIKVYDFISGNRFVEHLQMSDNKEKFSLIFTDINMPGMDGISLCSQTKQKYPDTKIFMLSAYDSTDFINDSMAAGASGFISKPLNFEEVDQIIDKEIGGR